MAQKHFILKGGRPTSPAVSSLMAAFGSREHGSSTTYEEISKVIKEPVRTTRWNIIVTQWRKELLRARNVATVREAGAESVRFLYEHERAKFAAKKLRSGVRTTGRAYKQSADIRTEVLDDDQRQVALHVRRVAADIHAVGRSAVKEIGDVFAPPPQLPRVEPPKS